MMTPNQTSTKPHFQAHDKSPNTAPISIPGTAKGTPMQEATVQRTHP